uniref:Uncharacterized protein n=1 Tax=Oryza rufipogon TaxID=4529 RepID=A0A0E0Q5Z1_ORYRU
MRGGGLPSPTAAGGGLGDGLWRRIRRRRPWEGRIRRPTKELGTRRARRRPAAATLPPPQCRSHIPDPRRSSRITGLPFIDGWRRRGRAFSSGAAGRSGVPCRIGDSAAVSRRAAGQEGAQVASRGVPCHDPNPVAKLTGVEGPIDCLEDGKNRREAEEEGRQDRVASESVREAVVTRRWVEHSSAIIEPQQFDT